MNEEELQQSLRELEERIEGMEINLTPPEESTSNFTVYESAAGDRQMIVHFIDVKDYDIELPKNKEEARSAFLKVIKEHKEKQNRAISHGDLMVLNCQPCNYYCYVAKVDKTGGTGFQAEDGLEPPAAITDLRGERILHELVIWTETYPGDGGSAVLASSAIDVTTGDTSTFKVTEFSVTVEPCPEEPVIPDMWDALLEYFIGDEVEHNGNYYRAQNDNDASPPGEGLGGLAPNWVQIPEDGLGKKEKCPEEQEFSIPKLLINDSSDAETDASFKSRSLEVEITPGSPYILENYKPVTNIVTLNCDEIVTPILPEDYFIETEYKAGDFVKFGGKYFKAKIDNENDSPDDPLTGEESWEEVDEDDLPKDTQDPCLFASQRIKFEKSLGINGPQNFKSYDINVIPGIDAPDGSPFQMGTLEVTGGNSGSATPFDMYAITLNGCDPIPPAAWDSNTLYDGDEIVEHNGKYYQVLQLSQGNFPDDANNADLWNEIPEDIAMQPDPECEFDETFKFTAPQLNGSSPKDPITLVKNLKLSVDCNDEGDPKPKELLSEVTLAETSEEFTAGQTTEIFLGLAKKSQENYGDSTDEGSPQKLLTGINSIELNEGSFTESGSPVNVLKSIDSIKFNAGEVGSYPGDDFEVVTEIPDPDGDTESTTSSPVFETVEDSECGGCFVVKQSGNLQISKKDVIQTKKKYKITSTPTTVDITGILVPLQNGSTATTLDIDYGTVDAQSQKQSSKLILEAQKGIYQPMVATKDITLNGTKQKIIAQDRSSSFEVKGDTVDLTQTDNVYDYKGKELTIKGEKKFLSGTKSNVTFQPKAYSIVVSTLTAQLHKRTDVIDFVNGKQLTITPELTKVIIDYQRMYNMSRTSVNISWGTEKKKFTPEEAELKLSQEYDVNIKNSDIKEIHIEELKKLKLIPKTYTLEKYLHDLEFTSQDLSINTSSTKLESTECQTINVESEGTSTSNFTLQSGTVVPSETPVEEKIETLQMADVSTESGASFKSSKLEVSSSLSAAEDTKKINGVKLEDDTAPTPPYPLNRTFADVVNTETGQDDEYEINGLDISITDLDNDYVNLESFKLTTTPGTGGGSYPVESTTVTVTSPVTMAAQRMDSLEVDYKDDPSGDVNNVTNSQITSASGNEAYTGSKTGCVTSYVKYEDGSSVEEQKVTTVDRYANLGPKPGDPEEIEIDLDGYSNKFQNPDTTTVEGIQGPDLKGLVVKDPESSTSILTGGEGPEVNSVELIESSAPEPKTISQTEFIANSSSDSDTNLYIPQLTECPVNEQNIQVISENQNYSTSCEVSDDHLLTISQKIKLDNYSINCGVLSKQASTEQEHALPTIGLKLKPYYEHTLQVCDASGNPQPITVLTTTAPTSGSAEAAGYLINKSPCVE